MEVRFAYNGDYVQVWLMSTGRKVEVKYEHSYTFSPQVGDLGYLYFEGISAIVKRYPKL